MKKSKFTKIAALALTASMLAHPMNTKASEITPNVDDVLEDIFDDLENGETIQTGEKVFENESEPVTSKKIIGYSKDLQVGDIVKVFGFGYESADGLGNETRFYAHETLAIVGVKTEKDYPYALVEINEDGSLSDIVGWFPQRSIRSTYAITATVDYADVLRTIVPNDSEKVNEEGEMDWITNNQFYELGEDYAVKAEYIWPEPNMDYDYRMTTKYDNQYQVCEFYSDDEVKFVGVYDWETGIFFYKTEGKDTLSETPKTLEKRYNIESN